MSTNPNPNLTTIVNVRLTDYMHDQLVNQADRLGLNFSQLIRLILADWLVEEAPKEEPHDTTA